MTIVEVAAPPPVPLPHPTPDSEAAAEPAPTPPVVPPAHADDDTGEFSFDDWTMPPERRRRVAIWLIPLLIIITGVGIWAVIFLDSGSSPTTTVAATPNSLPPATVNVIASSTTTTLPPPTTTAAPTTTVAAFAQPSQWALQSAPVDPTELTLKAAGIGPIDIGTPIEEAAGVLTASLGEADAAGIDGVCQPLESYWLQWGRLKVIFDGDRAGARFVSYRYETSDSVNAGVEFTTLSGVALGDSVADLQDIYKAYTVSFEVIESKDYFRLSDGGQLLLWGPVTSTDSNGVIEGIYSPSPCP